MTDTREIMSKFEQLLNDYAHKEQGYTDNVYPFVAGYLFSVLSSVLNGNEQAQQRIIESIHYLERNR